MPSRLIASLALLAALPALAQTAPAPAAAAARAYDIPPGPLSPALSRFAGQAGVTLSADPALTEGLRTGGLRGSVGVLEGFAQLLQGTGLAAAQASGGAYVLRRLPAAAPAGANATLPEVKVTAEAEAQADRSGTTEGSGSFTTRSMSSATHLPLSMRETPQSVTVLSSARIEADNLVDLVSVAAATPGIVLQSYDIRPVLQSRGYIVESVTQDGIATLYDWYSGDSLGNLAMQDRVEVVRGATGLMQGGGNPSAAINMIRKRPTSTWQARTSVSVGSWDDYRLMADVSGPLTEDGRIRGRVVGYAQKAGDYYDRAFNNKGLGYATVDIDLTPRTTLNIGYSNLYSNKNLSWGGMPTSYGFQHLNLPRSTFVGADWEYNKNNVDTLYASLAHDFGDGWKLNFNGTYVDGRHDLLATALVPTPDVGGYGHVWWAAQTSREQKAADLKVSGPVAWFGRKHDLVLGATLNRQNGRISEWFEGWDAPLTNGVDLATWNHVAPRPDTSSTSPWLTRYASHFKQDSLYSAGKFNVANTLDLILGARLDWYDRGDTLTDNAYTVNAHLTKYAGLTWKFADNHSAYVSYTDVFQPQNVRDIHAQFLSSIAGKNYEVGVKGEYLGGALNAGVALFLIDEENRAVYLADQSACPVPNEGCYAAAGLVRTKGIDAEIQGALTSNWQIGAGITWSESRYRKDANPDNIGQRLSTMIPTTLFKLSTQYTLPGALNRLTLGGRVNWQSKMFQDRENAYGAMVRNQQGARAVVDLSASYRLTKNVNVKLDINNVFDKVYYSNISGHWYWGANEAYGRPRSALLTLNANF